MTEFATLIQAIATLLWPLFAFTVLLIFRTQIGDALGQIRRMRKGKFLGQEIELRDMLEDDESSRILSAYLFPAGRYSNDRAEELNLLLRELGVLRDIQLILDGADGSALRQQLIDFGKRKGLALELPTSGPA
jgi:hypothetical protein